MFAVHQYPHALNISTTPKQASLAGVSSRVLKPVCEHMVFIMLIEFVASFCLVF